MRLMADLVQIVGLVLIAIAAFTIWLPLGLFTTGLLCVLFGLSFDPRLKRSRSSDD